MMRLAGDSAREAISDEVKELRAETHQLNETAGRADAGEPPAQKKEPVRERENGINPMEE